MWTNVSFTTDSGRVFQNHWLYFRMLRYLTQLLKETGRGKREKLPPVFHLQKQNSLHEFEEPLYIFHKNLGLLNTCRPLWTRIVCTNQKVKWQFDSSHWLLPPWGVELQIPEGCLAFPSLGMMWGSQSYCPVLISNKSIFAKIEKQRLPRQFS